MPDNRINAKSRTQPGTKRRAGGRVPDYSRGNRSWNTEGYKDSVRTTHTDTKVMKSPSDTRERGSYYYDNTVTAQKERRRKNFDIRREMWLDTVRKSRRRHRAARKFLSFIIISVAVIALMSLSYKFFFVVSAVNVDGAKSYTPEEIVRAAGLDTPKNLFSFSSRVAGDSIRFYCPKISKTDFDRTIPNKVNIAVEEESPTYYAEIYGDVYGISDSLRVVEKLTPEECEGLIRLKLQTVEYAVSGGKIELASARAQRFLEDLSAMLSASALKGKLTQIDLRNDFDVVMVAENKYKLIFGTQDEFDIKIRLAVAMLEDDIFKGGSKAIINLEDTSKTSVIIDNQLEFD